MGIYKRKDSRFWWMAIERPGQRPLMQSTKIPIDGGTDLQTRNNRRLAQACYAARMGDLARARHELPKDRPDKTFADYRAWYAEHVSSTKKGRERELSMLRQLGAHLDGYKLAAITKDVGLEWRQRRSREVSAGTVNREMQILKRMLSTAIPEYLATNPIARMPELSVDELEPRLLEPDEEARLLPALSLPARALVVCALDTLQRLGTLCALTWGRDHGAYLTVERPKGRRTTFYRVPVSERLRALLDALRASRGAVSTDDLVWPEFSRGGKPRQRVIAVLLEQKLGACGIPSGRAQRGLTFHGFRHTGASRMLNRGVDVKTVAEIGNWTNLSVLQRYLHPIGDAMRRAVESVGGAG